MPPEPQGRSSHWARRELLKYPPTHDSAGTATEGCECRQRERVGLVVRTLLKAAISCSREAIARKPIAFHRTAFSITRPAEAPHHTRDGRRSKPKLRRFSLSAGARGPIWRTAFKTRRWSI